MTEQNLKSGTPAFHLIPIKKIASLALFPGHPVTVSIGVATLKPDEDSTAWMKRSDEHLYRVKSEGCNRVMGQASITRPGAGRRVGDKRCRPLDPPLGEHDPVENKSQQHDERGEALLGRR